MSDTTRFDVVTLRWEDFYWSGDLYIPLLGHPGGGAVELGVNTKDDEQIEPCQDQIRAWRSFIERNDAALDAMLDAVFAYYTRMRPQYAKAGPEWILNMPHPKDRRTFQDDQAFGRYGELAIQRCASEDRLKIRMQVGSGARIGSRL
jgi:hypothetical protein